MKTKKVSLIPYDEIVRIIKNFMDVDIKTIIEVRKDGYTGDDSGKFDLVFESERTKKEE